MSSFFQTVPTRDGDVAPAVVLNVWKAALFGLAAVLVLGGVIAVAVGLGIVGDFDNTVLGQNAAFDGGVATAIVGGASIFLGVVIGAVWLVLGAVGWDRRH